MAWSYAPKVYDLCKRLVCDLDELMILYVPALGERVIESIYEVDAWQS